MCELLICYSTCLWVGGEKGEGFIGGGGDDMIVWVVILWEWGVSNLDRRALASGGRTYILQLQYVYDLFPLF
jgi:hypothetical protein